MPRVVLALLLLTSSTGRADPAAADRAIAEAEGRAAAKDFLGAAAKFREAYAADPRPDTICNVGIAYYKAQELTRAQLYLGRCLERGSSLDGKFIETVRARLANLEQRLRGGSYSPVDIVVEPRFATVWIGSFAPDETFDGGRTVWLAVGSHRVTVRADGYLEKTVSIEARDHEVLPVRVSLDKLPSVVHDPGRAPTPVAPADRPREPSMGPPIAATVATVGFASVALYAALQARDHADRAQLALTAPAYQTETDSVSRWNTIFAVDAVLGGVAAVASGYLWYRVTRHRSPVEITGTTVSLRGRF